MASKKPQRKQSTQRRLAAILSADVAGFSRLMGGDEEATIETLTSYRKVFFSKIQRHHGRVVDAKGDAILAEFASVVDAVNGAVKIQRGLAEKNIGLPDGRRMDFRIGINLGDVVVKDGAIYGDGVNIAARLESLAEPGGICISRSAYDQVKSKLRLKYEDLGEQQVKNIAEPVRVYAIVIPAQEGRAPETAPDGPAWALPQNGPALPDKPSLAVLAFENMSGDPEQEYFSDGIAEDIITDLSRLSGLFVIARHSSFAYKGRNIDIRRVGQELGVRYVLEGSVRRAGGQVRITAQLINAADGRHIWADRFDRTLEDLFAVQDAITAEIVAALDVKLVRGEQTRIWRRSLKNPEALKFNYRGQEGVDLFTKEAVSQARRDFEQVIRLEPESPLGYAGVALCYFRAYHRRWGENPERDLNLAEEFAHKALAADDGNARAHAVAGRALLYRRDFDGALAECQRAAELEPNSADVVAMLGVVLLFSGAYWEVITTMRRAIRLSPVYPPWYLSTIGAACLAVGEYEQAAEAAAHVIRINPDYVMGYCELIRAYWHLGRGEDARRIAAELLKKYPAPTIIELQRGMPYRDKSINAIAIKALQQAGIQ